jgi:hypothetical protein
MILTAPENNGQGCPCPFNNHLRLYDLLHFGQMGDRTFGMLGSYICMTSLAMLNAFLEMFDSFIDMRIFPCRPGMLDCLLTMLHGCIGMSLFTMGHSFFGMFQGFSRMLIRRKGEPAEQRETDKGSNRCQDQCSSMDSRLHEFLLSDKG